MLDLTMTSPSFPRFLYYILYVNPLTRRRRNKLVKNQNGSSGFEISWNAGKWFSIKRSIKKDNSRLNHYFILMLYARIAGNNCQNEKEGERQFGVPSTA